jgi:ATP-dependent protease Clp ATPase subunit
MLDINNLPQVRNISDLRAVMELVGGAPVEDKHIIWFVCVQEGETLSDMNLRERAQLFSCGITAITTLDQVQEHLDTYFDGGEFDEENNRCLLAAVARHYNNIELSEHLLYDADE